MLDQGQLLFGYPTMQCCFCGSAGHILGRLKIKPSGSPEIMARLRRQTEVRQFGDFCGHDVNDSLVVLNLAGDDERGLQVYDEPGFLKEAWAHDGVRGSGLVFQRDEAKSLRRARPLATGHGSRDRHAVAMPDISEVGGGQDAGQLVAQQLHRVRAGR